MFKTTLKERLLLGLEVAGGILFLGASLLGLTYLLIWIGSWDGSWFWLQALAGISYVAIVIGTFVAVVD